MLKKQSSSKYTPIAYMYGLLTYIWVIFMASVGKYNGSHGALSALGACVILRLHPKHSI